MGLPAFCVDVKFLKNSAGDVGPPSPGAPVPACPVRPIVPVRFCGFNPLRFVIFESTAVGICELEPLSEDEIDRRELFRASSTAKHCSIARTISPLHPSRTNRKT